MSFGVQPRAEELYDRAMSSGNPCGRLTPHNRYWKNVVPVQESVCATAAFCFSPLFVFLVSLKPLSTEFMSATWIALPILATTLLNMPMGRGTNRIPFPDTWTAGADAGRRARMRKTN